MRTASVRLAFAFQLRASRTDRPCPAASPLSPSYRCQLHCPDWRPDWNRPWRRIFLRRCGFLLSLRKSLVCRAHGNGDAD